jgi:hypothetical protein
LLVARVVALRARLGVKDGTALLRYCRKTGPDQQTGGGNAQPHGLSPN